MSSKFLSTKCFGFDLLSIFPWLFRNLFGLVPLSKLLCRLLAWLLGRIPNLIGFLFVFPFRRPSLIFWLLPELLVIGWLIADVTVLKDPEGLINAVRFLVSIIPILVVRALGVVFFLVACMFYSGREPQANYLKQKLHEDYGRDPTEEELVTLCTPEDLKEREEHEKNAWYDHGEATFYGLWLLYYVGMGVCCYLEYHGMVWWALDQPSCLFTLLTWPMTPFYFWFRP